MKNKTNWIRYLVTFCVGLLLALGVMIFYKNNYYLFELDDKKQIYAYVSDIFLIPSAFLICIGLLVAISNEGFFDLLGYAFSGFFYLFSRNRNDRVREKYIDYHERRKIEREGRSSWYMVIVGLVYMVPCVIFALLYLA